MFKPSCVVAFGVLAVVILSGCSGISHPVAPKTLNQTTSSSASAVARPSPSPSPSTNVVPVDQIPPGNPESWVPAGVPTKGPFQETGDEVPKFTRPMFEDTELGARRMADYYQQAENWAAALGEDPIPYLIVCDAKVCARNASKARQQRSLGRHLIRGRTSIVTGVTFPNPKSANADFIIQRTLSVAAGKFVESSGKVIQQADKSELTINLYMKWNGKMWRVTEVFWVR